jgi:hypothetical protein
MTDGSLFGARRVFREAVKVSIGFIVQFIYSFFDDR